MSCSSICQTATDALLAKYSAIILTSELYNDDSYGGDDDSIIDTSIILHPHTNIQNNHQNVPTSTKQQQQHDNSIINTKQLLQPNNNHHNRSTLYKQLLRSMTEYYVGPNPKRQSPLINAGYAIRVSCMLQSVKAFINFHRYCNPQGAIQIINIGCGLDVIGLWSLSLLFDDDTSKFAIHVVEIDFPTICHSKQQAILELQYLKQHDDDNNTISSSSPLPTVWWHGVKASNSNATYTLVSVDLEDISNVNQLFTKSTLINQHIPTLVISELVVSYLSTNTCNHLLNICSSLFHHSGSCTILYEALGPMQVISEETIQNSMYHVPMSVLESYQTSYINKFNDKLQRGQVIHLHSDKHTSQQVNSKKLFPLGSSCDNVARRLKKLGYDHVNVASAGIVASRTIQNFMDWYTKELFDEHAALTMHLRSYVLVVAFPTTKLNTEPAVDEYLFRRFLCPWMSKHGYVRCPYAVMLPRSVTSNNESTTQHYWMETIQKCDEKQVRNIFSNIYKSLFDEYPSIRKMVKTSLRKDLGVIDGENSYTDKIDISVIGERYRTAMGGEFIVAVQYNNHSTSSTLLDTSKTIINTQQQPSSLFRQVLGAIGIRKCTTQETIVRELSTSTMSYIYEIQRFFVDNEYRNCHIGTSLYDHIVSQLIKYHTIRQQRRRRHQQEIESTIVLFYLTATTPSILYEANQFYISVGFTLHHEHEIHNLRMCTYIKAIYGHV